VSRKHRREARSERLDSGEEPRSAGDFEDAEAAIGETIRYFSRAAAETDDPTRAREYLSTVREAAETLRALRR
jgi:hypothetical protein